MPSVAFSVALRPLREHTTVSRLSQLAQSFRPICSRASCSWASKGSSRLSRAPLGIIRHRIARVETVGAFSTSTIRRTRPEDATSSPPKPLQVGLNFMCTRSQILSSVALLYQSLNVDSTKCRRRDFDVAHLGQPWNLLYLLCARYLIY
jgi:hypothetical protein